MKTITELNEKVWYRFLKVIFILCYTISILLIIYLTYTFFLTEYELSGNDYEEYLITFIIPIFLEIIKRSFYYIVLGNINPKK